MDLLAQDSSTAASVSSTGEKVCNTCGETRHITEFVLANGGRYKDGRKNICKACQRAKNAEYAKRNPKYWAERARMIKEQRGAKDDTWKGLDAALSMCRMTIPLQKAA